ncbi:hypothetical protein IW262DRAFT_1292345 [Armillaria fumosa]|nr:hypothetical protein IW262DRAFT_1292345 [Armillaria fumosa]
MLEKENQDLRRQLAETEVQRDAAETHAVFASRQAAVAQYKLNKTKEKTTGKSTRFPTSSRVVTSQQGRDEAKKYEDSRKKKQDAAQKKKQAKKTKEREDLTMTFTGSLSSKNKTELGDLAAALDIPSEGLTVSKLREDISQYFMEHPDMKLDERYLGIFSRSRKRPVPAETEDEMLPAHASIPEPPPPAQRRRLNTAAPADPPSPTFESDQRPISYMQTYPASASFSSTTGIGSYQQATSSTYQSQPLSYYNPYVHLRDPLHRQHSSFPSSSGPDNDVRASYMYPSSYTYHQ